MKVVFDGAVFSFQVAGGISRYYANLARELNDGNDVSAEIIAPLHCNSYLSELDPHHVLGIRLPDIPLYRRICAQGTRFASPILTRFSIPDVIHETYYRQTPLVRVGRRRVITVYDMIHEIFMPTDHTCRFKRAAVDRADHIFCISKNTKRDLCERYGVPDEKVSVTYLGYMDFSSFVGLSTPPDLAIAPYFLYVGNRSGYKNFELLLRAFAIDPQIKSNFRILCFGGGPFNTEELSLASSLGLSPHHLCSMQGSDGLLGRAYANAVAFVYPSRYEGFGLPPLEAMSVGCPVLSSNTSSLPEVVGEAGLYFDPSDIDALASALRQIAGSESLRNLLISRGHRQRMKFSWRTCAAETAEIYRRIL